MSDAMASRVSDASPPRQRSSAPNKSVLPAPVSPVSTLNPGPNSRRASWITPSPWAYSSNNWDLGMTLSKALVETRGEIETARGHDADRCGALAHFDELAGTQRANVLSVRDDDGRFVIGDP